MKQYIIEIYRTWRDTEIYFFTFTQSIQIYHLKNITKEQEQGEAQCQSAVLKATIHYATLFAATVCRNCGNCCSAFTLPTIPAVCERNFFSDEAVIFAFLWNFVHQATSKTSEQLARSFNLPQIFYRPNVKEAVILIRATQERIVSLLNTMFSCHNIPFLQLIGCFKNLHEKLRSVLWL